ncbi:amidohydrolase [Chitinophaga pendula]|uniref:amidohydrolase n=1 Tax=Chitinophaga TaxID=79328 RepID=UPI000BAEAE32|nr:MULTISPECIES: amidohydrolase [Chitinophaga]ASZ10675.1 amidohydrolase [Chitinophaga sp. MD30]UCJ06350.1 amidohydrolase [Chitinophaga pendula]
MKSISGILLLGALFACNTRQQADLIIHHATIYTVDSAFGKVSAMAVKDGKILATGSSEDILARYDAKEVKDVQGAFVYPGFIDAHAHFQGYGYASQQVALEGTKSWEAVLDKVKTFAAAHPRGWIVGRGWDQNDWQDKVFPDKAALDSLFPDRPVALGRVDGHAAIANQAALQLAGIQPGQQVAGGEIEMRQGKLTGILVDNAVRLLLEKLPAPDVQQQSEALLAAERNCFAAGLTSVTDCGLMYNDVSVIDSLQQAGKLKMRIYVMLSDVPVNYDRYLKRGPYKTAHLNVGGFKCYADGALGSRGACLIHAYTDRPGWVGFLLKDKAYFEERAEKLVNTGFQMCTHAIGDSANREILRIYAKVLKGKNDRRWRIEHAQVVDSADFALFGNYNIVPSVQPTHATSDMYWAAERLGPVRVKEAYAYQQLLQQNGWIPLGTDFPVEDINPLKTFLAATARMDASGYPQGGFQPENALSRQDALRGMTIWAAKAGFEEHEKGSLEKGKYADFVVLDQDLLVIPYDKVLKTRVVATYSGGKAVYERGAGK